MTATGQTRPFGDILAMSGLAPVSGPPRSITRCRTSAMYGRRPRCKGESDGSAERSGAAMYDSLQRSPLGNSLPGAGAVHHIKTGVSRCSKTECAILRWLFYEARFTLGAAMSFAPRTMEGAG